MRNNIEKSKWEMTMRKRKKSRCWPSLVFMGRYRGGGLQVITITSTSEKLPPHTSTPFIRPRITPLHIAWSGLYLVIFMIWRYGILLNLQIIPKWRVVAVWRVWGLLVQGLNWPRLVKRIFYFKLLKRYKIQDSARESSTYQWYKQGTGVNGRLNFPKNYPFAASKGSLLSLSYQEPSLSLQTRWMQL